MPIGRMLHLAWKSLCYRRGAVALTVATIAVSIFTLLGTEHIRQAAKQSFNSTLSGVDLIVGPRTSDLNLLLTTVFRIGHPSQNMSWRSYQKLLAHKDIAWIIPFSLGDSHKGFRVVGTQAPFFNHFKYGQSRSLAFDEGQAFTQLYDVVLGAQVASQLQYSLGDRLVIAHGVAATSFQKHDAHPFTIVGILEPTGTPVDNALYVSLAGLEAIHDPAAHHPTSKGQDLSSLTLEPTSISSAMIGLRSKLTTFKVQRLINTDNQEPLTAILPGVALTQLWQMSSGLESTLQLMAHLILLAALMGLGAVFLATLRERRYEFAVMRTLGASASTIFWLIHLEAMAVVLLGIVFGSISLVLVVVFAAQFVSAQYGIDISLQVITLNHGLMVLYVLIGAMLVASVPALKGFLTARLRAAN